MTSVKDSCPNCHEWINRCTCPPDPLKAKLGFEREADTIANTLMAEWPKLGPSSIWLNLRRMIVAALEAAFSKAFDEGYRKGCTDTNFNSPMFEEGWNACREESVKLAIDFGWALPMYDRQCCNEASDDSACEACRQLAEAIRALKPAKGESR